VHFRLQLRRRRRGGRRHRRGEAALRLFFGALLALACAAAQAGERAFELKLAGGKLAAGASTLRVAKGDKVELRWTSDRRIVLHLHGYDIEATVAPGAPASMAFTATLAGRFPVTEHAHGKGHHRAVLYHEVHP
jgi:FtsP/CotA-like multicopper oxidase with cupredoxin domain